MGEHREQPVIGAATTSRWARILLPAVLAAIAWSAAAGERCESHFPELRSFVERAGSRATPDADTAGVLIDELAVERALWDDEVARHRARLETAAAHLGLSRLQAADDRISTALDRLDAILKGGAALEETALIPLLACPADSGWTIRSTKGPTPETPPVHREVVLRDSPPDGYQDAPTGAHRPTKTRPADVWPDDPLHPIAVKAAELDHDPVALYRFVVNEIRSEHSAGPCKSPEVVLASGSGNDVDQARLLAELLRSSGYPARLARGVVELPTDRLLGHYAVADSTALESLLTSMGVTWSPVGGGLQPTAYRVERSWCEVWIAYTEFRGLELDGSGETWAVLDPELEKLPVPGGRRVLDEISLDADAFLDDYLAGLHCDIDLTPPGACSDPRDVVAAIVDDHLAASGDPDSYETLASAPAPLADDLPILAASMPGHIVSVSWIGLEPPLEAQHRVRVTAWDGGRSLLDTEVPLSELTGREAALWYAPATPEDEQIVRAYDNDLWAAPPYLLHVTPTVINRGGELARGHDGIGMGRTFELEITVTSPNGTSTAFANRGMAGVPTVLGAGAGPTGYAPVGDSPASSLELLSFLADSYLEADHRFAGEIAVLEGLGLGFARPSVVFLGNEVEADGAMGLIQSLEWRGLTIDADVRGPRAAGGHPGELQRWRTLTGLAASAAERGVFEDFGVASISADSALVLADRLGVEVLTVDGANLAAVLPTLPFPSTVLAEIEAWVMAGGRALVPAQGLALSSWEGIGYLLVDPATGDARYQLAGALSGGSTTMPPDDAQDGFGIDLWPPTRYPVNPDPAAAVALRKLAGFDGTEGTVGEDAAVDVRVEALDERGARVSGVPVTFTSVAGGGLLVDAAGAHHQELTVVTDDRGTAAVGARFGTDTSDNAWYAFQDPSDEHLSRVSVHLVDAVGQGYDLAGDPVALPIDEPFWAVAFPDDAASMRRTDSSQTEFTGQVGQWTDTIFIAVEDQYGNPVSNHPVAFAAQALELDVACSNQLPSDQWVGAVVFDNLWRDGQSPCDGHPVLGSCGAPSLTKRTSYTGTSAGVIQGNVFAATYPVAVASDDLDPLVYRYSQEVSVDPTTQACDMPQRYRISSSFFTDEIGRNVNAAGLGATFGSAIEFWIEHYEPEPRPGEDPPFYSGGGEWRPVCSDSLDLPVGNGGSASTAVLQSATWSYRTDISTGALPGINELVVQSTDPRLCLTGEPLAQDLSAQVNAVWGIRPEIAGFDPSVVDLTQDNRLATPLLVDYTVEPHDYSALSVEVEVFDVDDGVTSLWPGSSRSGTGRATVPRGEPADPTHEVVARVAVNRAHPAEVRSADEPIPFFQPIFRDVTRQLFVKQELDVLNRTSCPEHDVYSFHVNHRAAVTLTVTRETPVGPGTPEVVFSHPGLEEGDYQLTVGPSSSTSADVTLLPGRYDLQLHGLSSLTGHEETEPGVALSTLSSRDALPVGHVMVKGVDLLDGHLVLSREDFAVSTRGVPLSFERSYSSASDQPGHLGQGWTHNWLARVVRTACNELLLIGTEGSGMRFTPDGAGGWRPPLGHHGTLVYDGGPTSEIDYFTTGGIRYHFLPSETPDGLPLGKWRLSFVEDPSANRTQLHYEDGSDGLPRLQRVVGPSGRQIVFTYENRTFRYWGGDVLTRVSGPSFLEVSFDYDERGNLLRAAREDDVRVELYDSEIVALRDVLSRTVNALNGATTRYRYLDGVIGLVGDPAAILMVDLVTEPAGGETRFFYDTDALAANGPELTTWVRDPRDTASPPPALGAPGPFDTTYTMNRYGSPTFIVDPLGHQTAMTWAADDIVMESRTDANGVETSFTHDGHGNLLTESVTVTDVDGGVHDYQIVNSYAPPGSFDPPHIKNRVDSHTDHNGAETTFEYDPAGRLTTSTITVSPAVGPGTDITTSHTYDANGDRLSTTDPRGHTTTFAYDGLGYLVSTSRQVTDHTGGQVTATTSSTWNSLGRPVSRTDPEGHTTSFGHDNLGRLIRTAQPEVEIDLEVYWSPVVTVDYDDAANTVTETDQRGFATVTSFDLEGRVVNILNGAGDTKVVSYDLAGNKVLESAFFGHDTPRRDSIFEYDAAGRLSRRLEPEGRITDYDHDPVGNLTRETLTSGVDPEFLPRVTEHAYDELNRRIRSVRDPPGFAATSETLLDGEGNAVLVRDAEGRETSRRYDQLGRLIETSGPDWRPGVPAVVQLFYDGNGNLEREIRFNERLTASGDWEAADQERITVFDELDRPIIVTDAEGHQARIRYDRSGNVVEEINRRGFLTTHTNDALNRRTSTTQHLPDPSDDIVTRWIHDAAGNLHVELWPNGNTVVHEYDGLDRRTSTSDDLGVISTVAYDAHGNRVRVTNGRGNATTFGYDALDRVIRETVPEISSHSYAWDVAGNRVMWINARGGRTDQHYDVLDRLVLTESPEVDGVRYESTATHDLVGNPITTTDARGNTTGFEVDGFNRVIRVTDPSPLSYTSTTTYDAVGNRVAATDRRGIPSNWTYDRENRLTASRRDAVLIGSTAYDPEGNAELVTDARGFATHTVFDERNLPVRIERPESSTTHLTVDVMGDVVQEIDGEGRITVRGYDLRRRLTSETNGEGEITVFAYDGAGNLTTVQRPMGGVWTRRYDGAERLTQVIDPLGHSTSYAYDAQNNLTNILDAANQTTVFEFDILDRMTGRVAADGTRREFTHDGNGNLLTAVDPKGQISSSTYDEINRETLRAFSAPSHTVDEVLQSIAFTWDGNSNLIDAVETSTAGTRTTHHEWDSFDRLTSVIDGFGKSVAYGYDLNGNRISLTDPDGLVTTYSFDGLNRLDSVDLPGAGGSAQYDWYRNSLLERVTYPNATTAGYGYDLANRVVSIDNLASDDQVLSSFAYGYDGNGNRSSQVERNGGAAETTGYSYDDADRLWRVDYPDRTTTYGLDAVGNRVFERSVGPADDLLVDRTLAYGICHRLLAVNDLLDPTQSTAYGYDLNGNQILRTQGGATLDFRYDVRDQLLEVDHNGAQAWTFSFDFRGLRVTKWGADGLLNITYDDTSVLQQHSAIGDPVATYRYGPDRLLATNHHSQGLAYYHFDALGSIANLTDPTGAVLNRYQYDAWGIHRAQSGSHWNPFGFTGHEYDAETGLYYAKARFYDPEVGRFLTEDPAEPDLTTPPSLHKYLYAYGNPTRYWDPLGLRPEEPEEELSWAAKAWAWVKSFVGIEDVKDAGDSLHEASQAFDEQVYGRRGSGSSLEEEIARREEHRQGVAETTGIVLENSKEAGTKLATAAVKATDAAGVTGIAKKGGRKLVTEIADTADNRIASRADDVARNKAVPESTQAGTKQADEVSSTTGLEANRWQSNEVLGRRVYQRNDLFDPAQRSSWFDKETNQWQTGTNVERMRAGLAPVDSAGRPIQLHHLTGTEVNGLTGTRGALAEVTETFHQRNAQTLNIARPERNPNIPRQTIPQYPSFRRTTTGERSIEADEFDAFRSAYWIERSKSF